jgi:hypothetical protein
MRLTEAVLEAAILQAARHQFRLEDDGFYFDTVQTANGPMRLRRVPESMEREAKASLRARYTDQVQQEAHTRFRGALTPKKLFAAAFRENGITADLDLSSESGIRSMMARWDEQDRRAIRAEGSSSISISNILSNVMNKFALQGYLFTESTWRRFCQIVPVNDFKPLKMLNLLGDVMFKQFGTSGELSNAALADQAFSNQAAPYGRVLTIPWTSIVNDDPGMLTGVPVKIGQGAGLTINDVVWSLNKAAVAGTINGDDGTAFFRTSSDTTTENKKYGPNKRSGADSALTSVGLTKAKALFDNQVDPNGNPLGLDLVTPLLVFGPSNWRAAMELMKFTQLVYGGGTAALQPAGNVWAGTMEPVMSRYIENQNYLNTTTGWGIFSDPAGFAPAIQCAFLGGQDTPEVLQAGPDYQFDRLGISIRGTLSFGAAMQNFRGAVWSLGA